MKILFAASEAVPYCKTGGLADVAGALSFSLAEAGDSVCLVLPLYFGIDRGAHKLKKTSLRLKIPIGKSFYTAEVWQALPRKNLKTYFLSSNEFFNRPGLYGPKPGMDHPDNDQRYSFFSRAVLELANALKFKPDVVHVHDWQTGLVPALLKTTYQKDPFFKSTSSLFSIHNMAYQGVFHASSLSITGLPASEFNPEGIEYYGKISYLKSGIAYADALGTVSPTYANEIMSKYEFGFGLEGLLRHRKERLRGIVNGLDTEVWNPKTDRFLYSNFTEETLKNREKCKLDLQKIAGFESRPSAAVLGFVGRLDPQKGVGILLEIAPELLTNDIQMVFLGVGDFALQQRLLDLQKKFRSKVFFETAFSEPVAHKIYAGCDLFLMPSIFEPCGLGQLIAMRYGALPVVMPTGGLVDTVHPYANPDGRGFVAIDISPPAFNDAIGEALREFSKKAQWIRTQKRVMKINFSWEESLPAYKEHYEKARLWRKKINFK